ncbi:DUF6615 family protein [Algicola sagamiensis]|uniref:DUF6615 family protein n=1 Tax=Algicola sagamiensis TaxID=163869 RepID=UPI00035E532F|nr:DUF6615 family protein [Algicola sagamiensis]
MKNKSLIVSIFDELSEMVWDLIVECYQGDVSIREDAITSFLLLSLKNKLKKISGDDFFEVKDTSKEESEIGCDFEISFKDGNEWVSYAIQAKKMKYPKQNYILRHKIKGIEQVDLQIDYANKANSIPLYCFYNHLDTKNLSPSDMFILDSQDGDIKNWGCSIVPSKSIKQSLDTHGSKNFSSLHLKRPKIGFPWSYLFKNIELEHKKVCTLNKFMGIVDTKLEQQLMALENLVSEDSSKFHLIHLRYQKNSYFAAIPKVIEEEKP